MCFDLTGVQQGGLRKRERKKVHFHFRRDDDVKCVCSVKAASLCVWFACGDVCCEVKSLCVCFLDDVLIDIRFFS